MEFSIRILVLNKLSADFPGKDISWSAMITKPTIWPPDPRIATC